VVLLLLPVKSSVVLGGIIPGNLGKVQLFWVPVECFAGTACLLRCFCWEYNGCYGEPTEGP
jgi:hypothetical protein